MSQFSAEDIKKFIEVLQAMNAIHPIIGILVAIIGLAVGAASAYNAVKTVINTFATKDNSKKISDLDAKIDAHNKRIDEHEKSMRAMKDEATREITAAANKVTDAITMSQELSKASHAQVQAQLEDIKKVAGKISLDTKENLSMIPGIQKAIDRQTARVDDHAKILADYVIPKKAAK